MISRTKIPNESFKFIAIFEDIQRIPTGTDKFVESAKFKFNDGTWHIKINVTKDSKCGFLLISSKNARACFSLLIINDVDDINKVKLDSILVNEFIGGQDVGWSADRITYSSLGIKTIRVECNIIVFGEQRITSNDNTIPLLMKSVANDCLQLFRDPTSADFCVICNHQAENAESNMSIPVHKCILYLRSAVFRTMLSSGMMESCSNEIIISDFDYEVVKEFINFLYLDTCDPDVLTKHAKSLLAIAHKYDVKGLIQLCENHLIGSLTVDTVMELITLGDKYECFELQKCAVDFIKTNYEQMIQKSKFYQCLTSEPSYDEVMTIAEVLK
jgi:hypothetical protein